MNDMTELGLDDLDGVSGGALSGTVVAEGSFGSNTGTHLNILVNWFVVSDPAGRKTLEADVYSHSYSLSSIAMETGVELTVNGVIHRSASNAVSYNEREMASNLLASFSIPDLSGAVNLSAVWHFNGTYSGTPLTDIRAEAAITI